MGKFKTGVKIAWKIIDKNLPTILSGLALIGLGGAVARATQRAPEAVYEMEKAKMDKMEVIERESKDEHELDIYRDETGQLTLEKVKLTPWEWFKAEAPVYWDTWLISAAAGVCIILSNIVGKRRYAALLAASLLDRKRFEEYRDKVKEVFGDKKESQIRQELAQDYAMDTPKDIETGYVEGKQYPCYLKLADLYFLSDIVSVGRAFNDFNAKLGREGEASLEDLIYYLDIPVRDSWLYERTVWECEDTKRDKVEPVFDHGSTMSGTPCLVIDVSRKPDK